MHYGKQDEYRSERREVTISLTVLTSRRLNLTPMARAKVDAAALQQFLDAGHNQADAARHFGVSEAAVSQRVKQLRIATSKVVALERAAQVVDQKLTAAQRLQHVQRVILDELTWAEQQAKQPGADRAGSPTSL
jgi:DNA-binding transcriptional regulator YdaS (Cro superfamily)